jgi:hypothetical protein
VTLVNPYCSVEQVQEELRNESDDIVEAIETAINQASRQIDKHKGRDYFFHDYSDTDAPLVIYSGMADGAFYRNFLNLPYTPIIDLTSVTVNGTLWTVDVDYIRQTTRLVSINGHWPTSGIPSGSPALYSSGCSSVPAKVEIVGTFGYFQADHSQVPTGLPADLNRAAILIAAAHSGHNQKEVVGVDGTKSAVYDKNIPKAALAILGSPAMVI